MKKILKIIASAFAAVTALVGGTFAYAAITGQFSDRKIDIETLAFSETNFLTIDNFTMNFTYAPADANNLDVKLRVVRGANAVTVPTTVEAGKPFTIQLNKDEHGNNIGGEVEISASSGLAVVSQNLKFWIDVAIPQNGLMIATSLNSSTLTAGGDAFYVFVFTNPKLAIYPDSRMNVRELNQSYKNITISSTNPNSLRLLNNGAGVESIGYYNPNHETNGQAVFSLTKNQYNTVETRCKVFTAKPLTSDLAGVKLSASSLRTYGMETDFVDINSTQFTNLVDAYRAFSNYVEKYKSYIVADTRSFTSGAITYESGEDFIVAVTQNFSQPVTISQNSPIQHEAAMYYLYVNRESTYTIQNVQISAITATNQTVEIPLFTNWQLNTTELIAKFGINLVAQDSHFTTDMRMAKIGSVLVEALKGIDEDKDGVLDTGVDLDNNGAVEGEELNALILVPAAEEFLIVNPADRENYDPANPIWEIQSLNPQLDPNNGLRLRFKIVEEEDTFHADVMISVKLNESGAITLKELPEMTINERLNAGQSEVKTYNLNSSSYQIANANPSYGLVKFFVTKDSATTSGGFQVLRLTQDYSVKLQNMKHMRLDTYTEAYEIEYSNGLNKVLEAINVSDRGQVHVFAAIVKTDYLGEPILDENNNYIIVEKSDTRSFQVTAYIDQLNFYTVNPETGIYTKRSVENDSDEVVLLSNESYTFYVTNLELDENGEFDADHYSYENSEKIDYIGNLTYALKNDAYGTSENPKEYIKFDRFLFSSIGDEAVIQIEPGTGSGGKFTYTYDTETNIISVKINVLSRSAFLETYTGDSLPSFTYNLYAEYQTINPVDLKLKSTISLRVVFASVNSEINIVNSAGFNSGVLDVHASATEGKVQWQYNISGNKNLFELQEDYVEFGYDIAEFYDGSYTSAKIDRSYKTPVFVQGYYKQVPQGQGSYVKNPPSYTQVNDGEGNYILDNGTYVEVEAGAGNYVLDPQTYDFVGEANGDYVFVNGYLQKLRNLTAIKWSTNKPEFVSITYNNQGIPSLKILKGTPTGELVNITVTIETYPDGSPNANYLQRRSKTITLRLHQDQPTAFLYSLNNIAAINGDHLIQNSSSYALKLDGGSMLNLLEIWDEPKTVYAYTSSTEGNPTNTNTTASQLIDIRFASSNASIIGDLMFKIQQVSQAAPSIYFKESTASLEKIYETRAVKVTEENKSYYVLYLYSENITTPKLETITITDPFGNVHYYNILVQSNIAVTIPVDTNISTYDSQNLNLNTNYQAVQTVKGDTPETLRLPVTFELVGDSSTNFAELQQQTTNVFHIGQGVLGYQPYVVNTGAGNYAVQSSVSTMLVPYRVSQNKNITIKMFYYVPQVDAEGQFVFVTTDGVQVFRNTQGDYVLRTIELVEGEEVVVETPYAGNKFYVFEKREFEGNSTLGKIIIKPTYNVQKGALLPQMLEMSSGVNKNLYVVTGNSATPSTTNFVDVVDLLNNNALVLPAGVTVDGNNQFNYAEIYNKFFTLSFDTTGLTSEEQNIYAMLNPTIVSGVVSSSSINADLVLNLVVSCREGVLDINGIPTRVDGKTFTIAVKFLNSVEYGVNQTSAVEGNTYNETIDVSTQEAIGHTYSNINKVTNVLGQNTITVQPVSVVLYSATNSLNDNFVNITGGQGEDLLKSNLSGLNLYYWNGTSYELYNQTQKAVNYNWVQSGGQTTSVSLVFNNAVNTTTKFKLEFAASSFGLIGNYFFTLQNNVTLQTNYPVFASYEQVSKGTQVNLHAGYINPLKRIQINYNGSAYRLETISDVMYLVNESNATDTIKIVNATGNSSSGINYFTYTLLNASKNIITSTTEISGTFPRSTTNNNSGTIVFTNNISSIATYYIRVTMFNGAFTDYQFRVAPNVVSETITVKENGVAITQNNPLVVNANTNFNLFSYIDLQIGSLSQLVVRYNSIATLEGFVFRNSTYTSMDIFTNVLQTDMVKLSDVNTNTLVAFHIYGYNFLSGANPVVLYVQVMPNFVATNRLNSVAAGISHNLINTDANGIFNLSGDTESGVTFVISTINNEAYSEANAYNAHIENNSTLFVNNLASTITLQITITKTFHENTVYQLVRNLSVVPNATITPTYNQNGYQQVTAPVMNDVLPFQTSEMVSIKNSTGNNIVTVEDEVLVSYSLDSIIIIVNNVEVPTLNGVGSFNTTTGAFNILPVNATTYVTIRVKVQWLTNVGSETIYGVNYKLTILPNIHNVQVSYTDAANKALYVYAASTVELNFETPNTLFATQNNKNISIVAEQNNGGSYTQVNLVFLEVNNSQYRLYYNEDLNAYFMELKQSSGSMVSVQLKLYLDLTGNYSGVLNTSEINLYDSGLFVKFNILPSITGITLKNEFIIYADDNNPNTPIVPMTINSGNPGYQNVGYSGDYVYNEDLEEYELVNGFGTYYYSVLDDEFRYVGENKGLFVPTEFVEQVNGTHNLVNGNYEFVGYNNGSYIASNFAFVGGEGNFSYNDDTDEMEQRYLAGSYEYNEVNDTYEYVGFGNGAYELTTSEQTYAYVGYQKGSYELYLNEYQFVGANNGDYELLLPNQLDLLGLFNLTLANGLSTTYGENIYVAKELLRPALVAIATQNASMVHLQNGIATFLPSSTSRVVAIQISLYTSGNQMVTLYFSLTASGALAVLANNGAANSSDNGFAVNATDSVNIFDYVVYGHLVSEYTIVGSVETKDVLTPTYTVLYRVNLTDTRVSNILNLNKNHLSLNLTSTNVASLQNGVLTFHDVTEPVTVSVTVTADGVIRTVYFTVSNS